MLRLIITGALAMLFCTTAFADKSVYDAVVSGKSCTENRQQNISCSFTVGKDLLIEIAGIGSPDTGIAFLKSSIDGDYYAAYGLKHGCVIIKNGPRTKKEVFDFAFVSPKNGKVYKTWESCQTDM